MGDLGNSLSEQWISKYLPGSLPGSGVMIHPLISSSDLETEEALFQSSGFHSDDYQVEPRSDVI